MHTNSRRAMTNPPTTQQKAAEAMREAHVNCPCCDCDCVNSEACCVEPNDDGRHDECCEDSHRLLDRALALARLALMEQKHEARCDCHPECDDDQSCNWLVGEKHPSPYVDPRCAAERDRIRREVERADLS